MRSSLHPTQSTQRGRQRGQALAEFTIAAAFVLIPLFLMIPLLGKFMDMKATTIQAARYAAWERTVWYGSNSDWEANQRSDAQIQSDVQQRFFADSGSTPLQSNDPTQTGAVADKPLWHDHTGASMLSTYSADQKTTQTPGTMNVVLDDVNRIVNLIGSLLGTKFRLDMESLYTSRVSLNAANTPAIRLATGADTSGFTAPNFEMKQVLVANGWSANGPDFVKKQTEALAILTLASREPFKTAMGIAQPFVGAFVPELNTGSLKLGGELAPDLVPPDRLTASTAPPQQPGKTAAQRRQEELDKRTADAEAFKNRMNAKTNALHDAIGTTQNTINSCKIDKQEEYQANFEECRSGQSICSWHSVSGWMCNGFPANHSNLKCTLKAPPGPGTSYTPIADNRAACNESLDTQIAFLQAKLADPDFQSGVKTLQDKLDANSALGNDPVFMKQYNAAQAAIKDFQTQIDNLKSQIIAMKNSQNGF